MGQGHSRGNNNTKNDEEDAFQLAMRRFKISGAVGGYGYNYFGGDEKADIVKSLKNYESSLSAKTKENIIRKIANGLKRLGLDINPEADVDEIIKQMTKTIPDPRKGSTFSSKSEDQRKICVNVANALNDEFTPGVTLATDKLIDPNLSNEEICRAVGEWVHSFTMGVNKEFLAVHTGLKNILSNVRLLDKIMADLWQSIQSEISKTGDENLGRSITPIVEVYGRAQAERRRQEILLSNMLNVNLIPAEKELELALRDESEKKALIKRLGLQSGTKGFSEAMARYFSGLATVSAIAQRVHKALKEVGLSINEYLNSQDFQTFQKMLDNKIQSGTVKPNDLAKFLEAVNVLKTNFSEKDSSEFKEAIDQIKDNVNISGGANMVGGVDVFEPYRTTTSRRVEKEQSERDIIIKDFASRIARHYAEFADAVKVFGPKIGKEIKLTDQLEHLGQALGKLNEVNNQEKRYELALVGRYIDAEARANKESFMNNLKMIENILTTLIGMDVYKNVVSDFTRLKTAIENIEKTVDYYSDVVNKKYSEFTLKYGGDGDISGGEDASLPVIAKGFISLMEGVKDFAYFYYVARVRENLARTSEEIDKYGEKYSSILGDAVAAKVYELEKEKRKFLSAYTETKNYRGGGVPDGPWPAVNGSSIKDRVANLKKYVESIYDTKIKFYRVVQAVDLYLKEFTSAIIKNPDDVMDIKKMLDSTQVVARWFSDVTGDSLWKAFEYSRGFDENRIVTPGSISSKIIEDKSSKHYYEILKDMGGVVIPGTIIGVPAIGFESPDTEEFKKAKKMVDQVFDHYAGLKNVINAFVRIGDKFGGKELRDKIFMTPGQMYKNLIDYLKFSAFSMHYKVNDPVLNNPGGVNYDVKLDAATTWNIDMVHAAHLIVRIPGIMPYTIRFSNLHELGPGDDLNVIDNFRDENFFFVRIIKAMSAKILTTLGVYDMFARPIPFAQLTPTRLIIGGDEQVPEVYEKASELYFRLPRLIEFYRGLLYWNTDATTTADETININDDAYKIAILPELEGIFSGLIRLIFLQAINPMSGDYSDVECRELIGEINRVFDHYNSKNPETSTKDAIEGLIEEVNRRYGLIKRDDMKKFYELAKVSRRGQKSFTNNEVNYAILPDEVLQTPERMAPSDQYSVSPFMRYDPATGMSIDPKTGLAIEPYKGRITLDTMPNTSTYKMVKNFRLKIEDFFSKGNKRLGSKSFSMVIKQAEIEIKRSKTKEDKFKTALKLIQGIGASTVDLDKSMLFHETVVTGLNILSAYTSLIDRFSMLMNNIDPITIESDVIDTIYLDIMGSKCIDGVFTNEATSLPGATYSTRAGLLTAINLRVGNKFNKGIVAGGSICDYDALIRDNTEREAMHRLEIEGYVTGGNYPVGGGGHAVAVTAEDCIHLTVRRLMSIIRYGLAGGAGGDPRAELNAGIVAQRDVVTNGKQLGKLKLSDFIHPSKDDLDNVKVDNKNDDLVNKEGKRITEFLIDGAGGGGAAAAYTAAIQHQQLRDLSILLKFYARTVVNYQLIMKTFVEALYGISTSSNGFIEVRILEDKRIQFDFSRFRKSIENILADVKFYMNVFRPYLPKDTIKRFEDRSVKGSIFWIEDNLIDRRLKGRTQGDADSLEGISRKVNKVIKGLTRKTSISYGVKFNTGGAAPHADDKEYSDFRRATIRAVPALAAGNARGDALSRIFGGKLRQLEGDHISNHEVYGDVFASLVWYDQITTRTLVEVADASFIPKTAAEDNIDFKPLVSTVATATTYPISSANNIPLGRIPIYSDDYDKEVAVNSLLFVFNRLFARYLSTLIDASGGGGSAYRIYNQLIVGIANGIFGLSMSDPASNCIPDFMSASGTPGAAGAPQGTFGIRGDPKPHKILLQSLGYILQRLMKDTVGATFLPAHLSSTLTDVPLYMKEVYRANLPIFVKMFDLVADKAIFLKDFYKKLKINVSRRNLGDIFEFTPVHPGAGGGQPLNLLPAGDSKVEYVVSNRTNAMHALSTWELNKESFAAAHEKLAESIHGNSDSDQSRMRNKLDDVLDNIISASNAISTVASEVLKELGDNPVYFQTSEGSIETFKLKNNGKLPLMPISALLSVLNDSDQRGWNGISRSGYINPLLTKPNKNINTAEFKFIYGTRLLIPRNTTITFDHIPWIKHLVQTYNSTSEKNSLIDDNRILKFNQNIVDAMRYIINFRDYKGLITSSGYLPIGSRFGTRHIGPPAAIVATAADFKTLTILNLDDTEKATLTNAAVRDVYNFDDGIVISSNPILSNAIKFIYKHIAGVNVVVNPSVITSIIESNEPEEKIRDIARYISPDISDVSDSREVERIYNLIDLNLMPINIHAMMRDIPLINLYNYDLTFDQMLVELYQQPLDKIYGIIQNGNNPDHDSRGTFLSLLIDPYRTVNSSEYGTFMDSNNETSPISRIFRGNADIGMGRPKFLSDQIFNKALMKNVYPSRDQFDEAGPMTITKPLTSYGKGLSTIYKMLYGIENELVNLAAKWDADMTAKIRSAFRPTADWPPTNNNIGRLLLGNPGGAAGAGVPGVGVPALPVNYLQGHLIDTLHGLGGAAGNNTVWPLATGDANDGYGTFGVLSNQAAVAAGGLFTTPVNADYAALATALFGNALLMTPIRSALVAPSTTAYLSDKTDIDYAAYNMDRIWDWLLDLSMLDDNAAGANNGGVLENTNAVFPDANTVILGLVTAKTLRITRYHIIVYAIILFEFDQWLSANGWENAKKILNIIHNLQYVIRSIKTTNATIDPITEPLLGQLSAGITKKASGFIRGWHDILPGVSVPDSIRRVASHIRIRNPRASTIANHNTDVAAIKAAGGNIMNSISAIISILSITKYTKAAVNAVGVVIHANVPTVPTTVRDNIQIILGAIKTKLANDNDVIIADDYEGVNRNEVSQSGIDNLLTFMKDDKTKKVPARYVEQVTVNIPLKTMSMVSYLRFNTVIVRNLMFITNVLRILRLKIGRELSMNRNVIMSSHNIVDPSHTEYGMDPFSPNEVITSAPIGYNQKWRDNDTY